MQLKHAAGVNSQNVVITNPKMRAHVNYDNLYRKIQAEKSIILKKKTLGLSADSLL